MNRLLTGLFALALLAACSKQESAPAQVEAPKPLASGVMVANNDQTVRAHVCNIAWKLGVTENVKSGVMAEIARRGLTFGRP